MGGEIFKRLLGNLDKAVERIPDNRHGSKLKHSMKDAVKSAFGVFFSISVVSALHERDKEQAEKNNAKSMLGIKELPSNAQVVICLTM